MVLGKKEVPAEYADRGEDAEEGAAEQAAAKAEPKKDEEPVAPGIPGFWLGAMRAHPLISEHVSLPPAPPHLSHCLTLTRSLASLPYSSSRVQGFCHFLRPQRPHSCSWAGHFPAREVLTLCIEVSDIRLWESQGLSHVS